MGLIKKITKTILKKLQKKKLMNNEGTERKILQAIRAVITEKVLLPKQLLAILAKFN